MKREGLMRKRFGENVSKLLLTFNPREGDDFISDVLLKKMVFNINVFGPFTKHVMLCNFNCGLIVDIDTNRIDDIIVELSENVAKEENFFCDFNERDGFSFSRGKGDS